MSKVGFRIYTQIDRPSPELIEGFKGIPVANISDNMGRIACVDSYIKPYNDVPLLGSAFTVRVPACDNLMFHKAIDMALPGDIIVVDAEGCMNHAICGELMFAKAIAKGITGFVLDGCFRDVGSLRKLQFSVFARGVNPKGPYKNGPGEINVPVSIGGQVIFPGDILIGDLDGLAIIKPKDAKEVLENAKKQNQKETLTLKNTRQGKVDTQWIEDALQEKGCQIIEGHWND